MRTMGDAWSLENIPLTWNGRPLDIVAVYRNGGGAADPAKLNQRFPATRYVHVWIDALGTAPDSCQVADVEKGDISPENAPGWVKRRRALVHTSLPAVYCDRSTLLAVQGYCAAEGLKSGRDYQLWISTLDGSEDYNGKPLKAIPGVVAVQVEGGVSAAWDRSVVYDDHWHPLA
jgi:hypothetical protein